MERKREEAIHAKETARNAREKSRIDKIKSATRQRVHSSIRSRNDVLRRLDLLPSNRQLLRQIVKYRRNLAALEEVKVDLEFLQNVRGEIVGDKIKFSLT